MNDQPHDGSASRFNLGNVLVYCAAFVIVIAGLQAASSILVPVLLAVFIAIVLTPPYFALTRFTSPTIALSVLITGLVVASFGMVGLIGSSVDDFKSNKAVYEANLIHQSEAVFSLIDRFAPSKESEAKPTAQPTNGPAATVLAKNTTPANTNSASTATNAPPAEQTSSEKAQVLADMKAKLLTLIQENSKYILNYAGSAAGTLGAMLGNTFLIVMIAIFLLLEASALPAKVRKLPGMNDETWGRLSAAVDGVRQYTGLKTALSLLTGFLVWVVLAYMGVEYAVMFGLLAFILNYVPNIGSLIAAIPAVLIAWLGAAEGENAIARAGIVTVAYVVINTVVGNIIEPKVLDKGLGLSASIIIVTMVFWGWVLGPVGMLLSVPLTMIAKIALEASNDTQWVGALMGSGEDESPAAKN
ncbi:MAG: AI-2E family transporter [Verrucomicrobiae bacterium]|jgi:AI-2 transport protein TqsA|nr:AI-2E family transporter [Verrucomicrobiae bacterium]